MMMNSKVPSGRRTVGTSIQLSGKIQNFPRVKFLSSPSEPIEHFCAHPVTHPMVKICHSCHEDHLITTDQFPAHPAAQLLHVPVPSYRSVSTQPLCVICVVLVCQTRVDVLSSSATSGATKSGTFHPFFFLPFLPFYITVYGMDT